MKPKVATYTDIEILAVMVARELKTEHWIDKAPAVAAYKIRKEAIRPNDSTDLRVKIDLARGIAIDVLQHWYIKNGRDLDELREAATEFASNIAVVDKKRADIVEMTKTVRSSGAPSHRSPTTAATLCRRLPDTRFASATSRLTPPTASRTMVGGAPL